MVLYWHGCGLSDRTQRVCFGGRLSAEIALIFGVPQGSVLGPLLFLLYTAELFDIIASLGLTGQWALTCGRYTSIYQCSSGRESASRSPLGRMYRATSSLDYGAERSEAERLEDPTDVAWITASTSQADHLSGPSVDNYVIFNS